MCWLWPTAPGQGLVCNTVLESWAPPLRKLPMKIPSTGTLSNQAFKCITVPWSYKREEPWEGTSDELSSEGESHREESSAFSSGSPSVEFSLLGEVSFLNKRKFCHLVRARVCVCVCVCARARARFCVCTHSSGEKIPRYKDMVCLAGMGDSLSEQLIRLCKIWPDWGQLLLGKSGPGMVFNFFPSLNHVRLFVTPWLEPARFLRPWESPGRNTGVGCHFLLQGIFVPQGSSLGLLHCRWILHCLSHQGSLFILPVYILVYNSKPLCILSSMQTLLQQTELSAVVREIGPSYR